MWRNPDILDDIRQGTYRWRIRASPLAILGCPRPQNITSLFSINKLFSRFRFDWCWVHIKTFSISPCTLVNRGELVWLFVEMVRDEFLGVLLLYKYTSSWFRDCLGLGGLFWWVVWCLWCFITSWRRGGSTLGYRWRLCLDRFCAFTTYTLAVNPGFMLWNLIYSSFNVTAISKFCFLRCKTYRFFIAVGLYSKRTTEDLPVW